MKEYLSFRLTFLLFSLGVILPVFAIASPLKVSGDENLPPYEFVDANGKPSGFNVEIFKAVCEVMNISYEIELLPWAKARSDLEAGLINVITGMYYSEERDEHVDFSTPYIVVTHSFFIRRNSRDVSPETLEGKKVLVQQGDIMHDYLLRQEAVFEIITVSNQSDALQLLSAGMYDAALLAKLQSHYIMEKYKIRNVIPSGPPLLPQDYCFAVEEGNAELLNQLNEGLAIIKLNGTYNEIYYKWFERYEKRKGWQNFLLSTLWILAPLILVFTGIVFWNISLKKQVIQATAVLQEELRQRIAAQQEVRAKEENLRTTLDSIGDGVISADRQGCVTRINPVAAELTGVPAAEAIGLPLNEVFNIINAFTRKKVDSPIEIVLSSGKKAGLANHTVLLAKNGKEYHIADSGAPILDDNRNITGVVLVFRDVTEEYAMRQDLRNAKNYIDDIINSMPSLLIAVDNEERIILWNDRAAEETGIPNSEAYGRKAGELLPFLAEAELNTRDVILSGTARKLPRMAEESGGTLRYREITLYPLTNKEKQEAVIRIDDISERVDLEEQLFHAQKMQAVGQLAGGIAHDFNNTLAGIMGAAELLYRKLPEEEKKLSRMIIDAAKNAADLTSKLLSFSSKKRLYVKINDLHQILDHSVEILKRSIDKNIRITLKKEAEQFHITGDKSQLQNAILNIGINAAQAMPGGGEFMLTTRDIRQKTSGQDLIEIVMQDTGEGIEQEYLNRIFDPFFTTKKFGGGTGLGLASVYGTVQSHNGSIRVTSTPGEGTTFFIALPVTAPQQLSTEEKFPEKTDSGRILVVDDEAIVRQTTTAILKELCYDVITADNGLEAINLIEKDQEFPALVLLDLIMPEMGGAETFLKLKAMKPDLPIIITSGYSTEKDLDKIPPGEIAGFLSKPYTMQDLSQIVLQALKS